MCKLLTLKTFTFNTQNYGHIHWNRYFIGTCWQHLILRYCSKISSAGSDYFNTVSSVLHDFLGV